MCQATFTTTRVPVLMVSEQVDANVGLLPSRDGGEALWHVGVIAGLAEEVP